ncbi:flavin reductase family protein [Micromonospora okii]|uniref:flavin reductase family protein n=1 Tax=Micromonospora okii TaxID=1182970 RepID=UPI001E2F49F9|nr:flavin reductase family protein [Micromonospora okii]
MTALDRRSPVELRPVDADLFRALLRRRAKTVAVVTAPGRRARRGRPALPPAGFTAASFAPVSVEPPLVSFCVGRSSPSLPTVDHAEHVAVHLLAADQPGEAPALAADGFADSSVDGFAARSGWTPGPFGVPLVDGALAVLLCRTVHRVAAGDHALVIAEPLALGVGEGGDVPTRGYAAPVGLR